MNKTYISSLLVVLIAGVQAISVQGEELDALMAEDSAAASISEAEAAALESEAVSSDTSPEALLERGIDSYKAGNYDEARLMFEAVLAKDTYNKQAMSYLRKVAAKREALYKRKLKSVRASAISDVKGEWAPDFSESLAAVEDDAEVAVAPVPEGVALMTQHMKGIQIPSLDFRDANIKDVVLFLTETCRRIDSSGKGVNMILLGLSGSDASGAEEGNNITISIRDLSLYDALKVIVEMASLRFEVQENMVMIMPVNYVRSDEIEIKTFSVNPEVGEELSSMAGGGDSGDSMDDLFGGGDTSMSADAGPVDVSKYFSIVDWPEGTSATYYPNFRKLIVKNTGDNIRKVNNIVEDLEDEAIRRRSSQVEIEAKFVEFADGSLSELGFDWNIYGSGSVGGFELVDGSTYEVKPGFINKAGDPVQLGDPYAGSNFFFLDPLLGYKQVQGPNAPGESLFGGGRRTADIVYEPVNSGILASMGGIAPSMLFSDGTVDLKISAMEQNGTADILSAPKVTTQSGYEAVIRVTEIHRYPQDWDVETGQRTAPVVKPQDWEDFDLGVVLRVTPEVDTESNTIKLELNPEIRKFKGFDSYYVAQNSYDAGTSDFFVKGGDDSLLFAEMAYFETRSVQTRVTVADGSTVMMGGLVDETTETFRDQVPILGDIPYLGRLFRTEGTRSQKKNLVIFVKATQVDEKGMTRVDREMARKAVTQ
jgi:general secretion pathway protein D